MRAQESLEAVRSVEGDVKCVVIHAGNLFGASGGAEPVPFLTGPKAEPVLDKSITRQAVLLGPGTVLSSVGRMVPKYIIYYILYISFGGGGEGGSNFFFRFGIYGPLGRFLLPI